MKRFPFTLISRFALIALAGCGGTDTAKTIDEGSVGQAYTDGVNEKYGTAQTIDVGSVGQTQQELTTSPLISVDTAGCNTNIAINNAIGQSVRVTSQTSLERLEIWIKPELYYTTSYNVLVFDGEGNGELVAMSPHLTLSSRTSGTPATWYSFNFTGQQLLPGRPYTFILTSLSTYSGSFSECGNVYADGKLYRLGYFRENSRDVSFRLYGSAT